MLKHQQKVCWSNLAQSEVPKRCTPEVMRSIIWQHLASPAMWCILPIQVCKFSLRCVHIVALSSCIP
jgi:hypothetical protein